jgi:hypothetical protein
MSKLGKEIKKMDDENKVNKLKNKRKEAKIER